MMNPEQFKKAADQALGGLTAGPALLNRARLLAASGQGSQPVARRVNRMLAMAMSLALVFAIGALVLPRLSQPAVPVLDTLTAGQERQATNLRTTADLPRGSLVLSQAAQPAYQGVWARGSGGNFPLLRVDGRYYRLLSHPEDVSSLLGAQVGSVAVFTDEPALDSGTALLSNVAAMDAAVYKINGMDQSAALAAMVNGQARLFQRVAFAGTALIGSESLKDSLPAGAVTLQLSEVGTVTDQATVTRLMNLLFSQAAWQGSKAKSGNQALLVQYANGIVLQMAVSGDSLSGAGTWACPEFFEAFDEAIQ